ncbi:MAG: glycosyltransferase family 4 protein [Clostridia bacterium]|nr:glycosyltransferase family 4 protein [Clostridia bacterium]
MKIAHICLCGPYTEGLNYQENLITKSHVKEGYDVSIITSKYEWNQKGEIVKSETEEYINKDNCKVYRLEIKGNKNVQHKFKRYNKIYETMERISPDILFIHNVQFLDIKQIKKYVRNNKNIKIFVDNHADFSNSGKNVLSRYILHGVVWKHTAKGIEPYTNKFYGVLPARVDFLTNVYKLPKAKCELLVMGADDELVNKYSDEKIKKETKNELDIKKEEFVIVTGGKIDKAKKQTLLLMKAIGNMKKANVRLLVFGSIDSDMKKEFDELCDGYNIKYLGWANNEQAYKYFSIADLVVFPGRHSVYWEQVVAIGIPMVCKYWEGTTHIDIGGNVNFIKRDSVEEIQNMLERIISDKEFYYYMKNKAMKDDRRKFLYNEIAKKSIE